MMTEGKEPLCFMFDVELGNGTAGMPGEMRGQAACEGEAG